MVEHFQNITGLTFAPALLASPETLARPLFALLEVLQHTGQLRLFERGVLRDARHVDPLTIMVLGFVVFIVAFGRIGAVASLLRKEACSGSIHDLTHNPTQNCLADCLTKASAKADNLITAVKRGRLLDVDIHSDFRTLMEQRPSCLPDAQTFLHTRDKEVFFLNSLKISLAPTLQERPFQVMFAGTQQTEEQKELNTRVSVRARILLKITSAFADSCIQFLWSVMPIPMTTLTWMRKNTPTRNTIEDFTAEIDEARFVGQYNFFFLLMRMLSLCLALMNLFVQCCAPFFQLCDHGSINTTLCREVGQIITGRRPSPGRLLL